MPTIEEWLADANMLAVATIPLHPGVLDYSDAEGKVILYVRDEEEGRSCYISFELYGEITRAYEVSYDDWAQAISKMTADVIIRDSQDPFTQLLMEDER